MNTYQFGNKVTCIIRAYSPCTIGDTILTYKNEPYTIIEDANMTLSFRDLDSVARAENRRELAYNNAVPDTVRITNVHLTEKILNLVFQKHEDSLKTKYENVISDEDGKIYLNTSSDVIYQVFIYDVNQTLVQAFGEVDPSNIVLESDTNYLVVYQELGEKGILLRSQDNLYFTLDFICTGNENEETTIFYPHIEKAGIKVDRQLYFNQSVNAIDLTFNIIHTDEDYITLK